MLVVEDNALRRRGHDVSSAANGQEALDLIDPSDPPCLIVLDLMMPVMDGWELRARLLQDERLAGVPVVLVSGAADIRGEALTLQALEYLEKPVDLHRLYDVVATLC